VTLDQGTVHDSGVWSTTYGLRNGSVDLTIIQRVSIAPNGGSIGGQSYRIDYEVINNNPDTPVTVDFMYHVDTMLGSNDLAPFVVDGSNITRNTSYSGAEIPGQVEIFDSLDSPYINGIIITNSSGGHSFAPGSEPDRLNLGQYSSVDTFGTLPPGSVGDSGYSLLWLDRNVGSESLVMSTFYGVRNPPPELFPSETIEIEVFDGYREVSPSLWLQSGANKGDGLFLTRYDCTAASLGIDRLYADPRELANDSLSIIDRAIRTVSIFRANAGAEQNRLEFTWANVDNTQENLAASESRIRDVDMAREMTKFTKEQILVQSSTTMLAQANALPQNVLQLLG